MIPTHVHARIDAAATAALAGLSLRTDMGRGARTALAGVAAFQAGYSALTEYGPGAPGLIPMRTHLRLDVAGALALAAAGLLLPRKAGPGRGLLLAAGLAELAVIGLSDAPAAHAHHATAYPPLDVPKPVADDVWIVDSVMGPGGPVRMTVVRLPGGDLLLHSPTRFDPALRRALEQLGRIRHLVAPNLAHWTFVKGWQDAVPGTVMWAAPGLRGRGQVRRSGLRIDHELGAAPPPDWAAVIDHAVVPGAAGYAEVAMLHRPSRTLLLTDLVLNVEPGKIPWLLRPLLRLLGIVAPDGRAPIYLRKVVQWRRRAAAAAAARLVAWAPERVVFAHGAWFAHDATPRLRHSLRWLLG